MSEQHRVSAYFVDALAAACRVDPNAIAAHTKLTEIGLDSLTLVAVLSGIEAAFSIELTTDITVQLMGTCTVGELVAGLARAARAAADRAALRKQ